MYLLVLVVFEEFLEFLNVFGGSKVLHDVVLDWEEGIVRLLVVGKDPQDVVHLQLPLL